MTKAEQRATQASKSRGKLLVVDLDGTLVKTDLLVEGALALFKLNPVMALRILVWAFRGPAALKHALAHRYNPKKWVLPYRQDLIDYLRQEKTEGATIVLATASDQKWADRIASDLGLFDHVIGSDGVNNLKGQNKLEAIQKYCKSNGFDRFCYAGDSHADLCIWEKSDEILLAGNQLGLYRTLKKSDKLLRHFANVNPPWKSLLRSLRPHQWAKNLVIFLPLILSHQLSGIATIYNALLAFLIFSVAASSVYVLNDVMDVADDRAHPKKMKRPFAAGELPLIWGPPLSLLMIGLAFSISMVTLPLSFTFLLAAYITTTTLYSFWLKRMVIIDVIILASLYTLRIFVGGVSTFTPVSEWLMAFSMFIFLSLALSKRYAELTRLMSENKDSAGGRGYEVGDLKLVETMGVASGFIAVLVMAMYVNSPNMKTLYTHAWALWIICPLILYWISRLWLLARRQQLSEDPVVFAIKDPVSLLIGLASVILALIAT